MPTIFCANPLWILTISCCGDGWDLLSAFCFLESDGRKQKAESRKQKADSIDLLRWSALNIDDQLQRRRLGSAFCFLLSGICGKKQKTESKKQIPTMFCSQKTKDHHGKCKETPSTKCSNHCCLHLPTLWKLRVMAKSQLIKHFPKLVSISQAALAEPNRAEQIPKWADPKTQFPNPNAHRGGKVQRSVKSQIPKPDLKSQRRALGCRG